MPSTLAIITNTFAQQGERQRALGIWSGTSGAGIALGPIVGGLLLAHFAWGSVFLINVPVALAGLALAVPFVPDSRDPDAKRADPVGGLLSIVGLGLLLLGDHRGSRSRLDVDARGRCRLAGLAVLGRLPHVGAPQPPPDARPAVLRGPAVLCGGVV